LKKKNIYILSFQAFEKRVVTVMMAMAQELARANAAAAGQQINQRIADELRMHRRPRDRLPTLCFRCGEPGHISISCGKSKKESEAASTSARVFVLGEEEEDVNPGNLV
jgi:hypothetical protein